MHTAPSLIARAAAPSPGAAGPARTLLDLMYDGFYVLFLLKNGSAPHDNAAFISNLKQFLDDFGRDAKKQGASTDDIDAARYAFCAAVDEIILHSQLGIRSAWEQQPLQLVMFGDQLAGEHFFIRLENLRAKGSAHMQALEVFHMCLLLGFQGRYLIEGSEKLHYLTARLGDELVQIKGNGGFAPHAQRPDRIINKLRNDMPLWMLCSVFALIGALGYLGLRAMLDNTTATTMSAYNNIVKLAPRPANLTITLP